MRNVIELPVPRVIEGYEPIIAVAICVDVNPFREDVSVRVVPLNADGETISVPLEAADMTVMQRVAFLDFAAVEGETLGDLIQRAGVSRAIAYGFEF